VSFFTVMPFATEPAHPRRLIHRSASEFLHLAVSVCDMRFAVAKLPGEAAIVNDPAVPLDAEESLALLAESREEQLVVIDEAGALTDSPNVRFYAAVKLFDSAGARRGYLALFDDRERRLSEPQKQILIQIAAQLARVVEMADMIRASGEERDLLQRLVDEAPVAVFRYGISSGRLSYVNARFAQTLGYTIREILDLHSIIDLIAEDQRPAMRELVGRREAGDDHEVRYVTKVRCRDGTLLDAEVFGSVAELDGARIVIGAAVDVTTQMAATGQLREREEYFRALTDHVSDVIAIVSSEHVLTYVSPSVERVLGHAPEELLGMVTWARVHPEDRDRFSSALTSLAGGHVFQPAEYRFQHRNGSWRTIEVSASNLLGHRHIRGLVLNLHDITDRKRMEQELGQLNRLTSLGRLAAQVAHEFNNVMMGIQPVVEVIRRRAKDDPSLLRFTDAISASIQRGKRVTTDILRFGRPAQPSLRPVNVQEFMYQTADEIRPMLGERIKLAISPAAALMHVSADSAQLAQVLVNLALNARDAMEARGGTLTIEARPALEGEIEDACAFVHFTVADTGAGIAGEDFPHIFEPLFTTKQKGTGLGLSVVFQVVTGHRGHITVDSEPGKGTTFHLFIPAVCVNTAKGEGVPREKAAALPLTLRVLIVEDEEAVASGLRWSLEAEGMQIHIVGKGADVLPAMEAFRPDVMVLDLSLPDEDGRAVYERVAAVSPLPVIFSSGHATESDIKRLVEPSRAAFLMKPYRSEELVAVIRRLVKKEDSHG
jgi:PAS domain S-box-containing protein